ncbi:MAG: carboxypeptidase regulatory-like domain-containing protein [Flavobacteriales bacterium]|nr:carboxypeptidase regulatory-like domain-containing protein [Flavobacteriales bacterium]
MKKLAFILAISALSLSTFTQDKLNRQDLRDLKDADFAFFQGDYAFALQLLEPLYSKDSSNTDICFLYGATMVELQQVDSSVLGALNRARAGMNTESLYYLGRAEHLSHHFETAVSRFTEYLYHEKKEQSNDEVERQMAISVRALKMVSDPVDVKVTNLGPGVNTADKEYVPVITGDGQTLYFTSRRSNTTAQLKDPNGEYFEDIYFSRKVNGQWSKAENAGLPINSETHDATVSISADGQTMIIYRTNKNLSGGDLYLTEMKNGRWSEPRLLDERINSTYQEASAALNRNASILYFSSNRPGGFGGKDIYRVKRLPNGSWSLPKNLGPMINTPYDEDAPFVDIDENFLYFSSNGHETMGGYDVFRSRRLDSERWGKPENLGYPVNTVKDDIFMTLDASGKTGYYTSAADGGFGQLDIYSLEFIYRENKVLVVKGTISDLKGNPVKARITLLDENSREVQGIYTSNEGTGKFILAINPLTTYRMFIDADGYRGQQDELYFEFPEGEEFELESPPYILIEE